MKLNKNWQDQWDAIEIPEKKIAQIIEQEVSDASKPADRKQRWQKQLARYKKPKYGLIAAVAILLLIAGGVVVNYQSKNTLTSDNTSSVNTQVYDQEAAEGEQDAALNDSAAGQDGAAKSSESFDKTAFFYVIDKETTTFDKDVKAIQKMAEEAGGYIQESKVEAKSSTSDLRYARFVLRIPSEQKGAFLDNIADLGTTLSENVTSSNYSLEYSDNESRINALKTEEEALLEMLKKSDKTEDMLKIQERLAAIRSEREGLTKSNRLIDNQVEYTSVTLTMNEITKIQKNEKSESTTTKIKNNWQKQLGYWKNFINECWIFLASNVFYLGVLVVAGVVGYFVYRKRKVR